MARVHFLIFDKKTRIVMQYLNMSRRQACDGDDRNVTMVT